MHFQKGYLGGQNSLVIKVTAIKLMTSAPPLGPRVEGENGLLKAVP